MKRTIGKFAQEAGVGVETIRYYQRRGLLAKPERKSGRDAEAHQYVDADVERLHFIRGAQVAGFTLAEIGELVRLDASKDRSRALQIAEERIAILDQKITEMQLARDALTRLAKACSSGAGQTCPIIASFLPAPRAEDT